MKWYWHKYKAWYKPLGVMIAPNHLESINFDTMVLGVYMEMDGKGFHKLRMSDFELKQFTGVHDDENENELYEGDIIEMVYEGEKIVCRIEYCGSGFLLASDDFEDGFKWISDVMENDGEHFWIPTAVLVGNMNEDGERYCA